jgi:hypothetical protein
MRQKTSTQPVHAPKNCLLMLSMRSSFLAHAQCALKIHNLQCLKKNLKNKE